MLNKKLKKKILDAFDEYFTENDLSKFSEKVSEKKTERIFCFIIQFDEQNLNLAEFNRTLSDIVSLKFVVSGIIGTYIFAYKICSERDDDIKWDLDKLVKNKKVVVFKTFADIQNCGNNGFFYHMPYFFIPNSIFEYFNSISYGEIYDFGDL